MSINLVKGNLLLVLCVHRCLQISRPNFCVREDEDETDLLPLILAHRPEHHCDCNHGQRPFMIRVSPVLHLLSEPASAQRKDATAYNVPLTVSPVISISAVSRLYATSPATI